MIINRRDFVRVLTTGTAASILSGGEVMAGPFETPDFARLVSADKKLDPAWVKSLFERGEPAVLSRRGLEVHRHARRRPLRGTALPRRRRHALALGHFQPDLQQRRQRPALRAPAAAGVARQPGLRPASHGRRQDADVARSIGRRLHRRHVSAANTPSATVEYRDAASPVAVTLEAFSPFIPLNTDDSSLPATVLRFTVKNTSRRRVEATLAGWLQNAVCWTSRRSARSGATASSAARG